MREEIKKQLNKLVSSDHNVRNDSFLNISLSVESVLIPSLTRDNEQLLDLHGLKKLRLTESEARIVLEKMSDNLCNNTIPLEIQVGIVSLLGKFKNIKYLEAVMRFLGQSYYNLDNEQVYSTLAAINPQDFSKEELVLIIELIQKSLLMEVLVELRKRNNDKVNDAIFGMWVKLRGINCLDECYFEEYIRSVLWYIRENYILLDNENINSVLKLLSVKYLSSFDSE
ncbi:MAG: hypothetical protein GWN67_23720, partial [Phycisphaerae bacterium]|nr:hypothetical protein [Phycisphaerae bacterium]NIP55226.1 hypothetical protein [Phycisphaerae bacterium]NIS53883.1 hypothetical protein [Phycisphaerae bacterium]NIU11495.1 hypothetical protein [Phycisphaerae bacterium]NIU59278.1 hypothetical protein [Phycisphaerae bacterium]